MPFELDPRLLIGEMSPSFDQSHCSTAMATHYSESDSGEDEPARDSMNSNGSCYAARLAISNLDEDEGDRQRRYHARCMTVVTETLAEIHTC